jgi:hypothetical protein
MHRSAGAVRFGGPLFCYGRMPAPICVSRTLRIDCWYFSGSPPDEVWRDYAVTTRAKSFSSTSSSIGENVLSGLVESVIGLRLPWDDDGAERVVGAWRDSAYSVEPTRPPSWAPPLARRPQSGSDQAARRLFGATAVLDLRTGFFSATSAAVTRAKPDRDAAKTSR